MYNATPLFYKHLSDDRFINKLNITDEQDKMLLEARKKVRQAIRNAFSEARVYLKNETIHQKDIDWISKLIPKFLTQGSYVYKTLNSPCSNSQEIDLDDGVYLPMSIIDSEPEANKDWFFAIVDGALKKLAEQEGWHFDGEKETCARIIIPGKQAHIDVPLYAIPDKRHSQLVESLNYAKANNKTLSSIYYSDAAVQAALYLLDKDEVNLATREGGWRKSDPMEIYNWFKQEISLRGQASGQRLRRVCRFLKAWRDYTWENGGPSSLALMICAVEAFPEDDKGRDDHALLTVVRELPSLLNKEVFNPAAKEKEVVYPRDDISSVNVVLAAQALEIALNSALSGSLDKTAALAEFKNKFGNRMPNNTEWIESISSASIVRSTPAKNVKPEYIPNTKSG